jgi:iron complex outermembrane receptor protein
MLIWKFSRGFRLKIRFAGGGCRHLTALAAAGTLNLMSVTGPAHAQTSADTAQTPSQSLEEIVVTAERRVEDVQKTAASVSVRNGEEMATQGRYSLQSIIEDVPGITGAALESTAASIGGGTDIVGAGLTIRGIQSNVGVGGAGTSNAPAAAIYVDGVYEGVGGNYDIDRVEVLRGPQGTLYGRSATSGLVAIHTRDPSLTTYGVNAAVEVGDYDLRHYTAGVDLPLIDNELGLRVAGDSYERSGYYNGDGGAIKNLDGKVKLLYKPNDDFSLLLGVAAQNNTDHTGGTTVQSSTDPRVITYEPAPVGTGHNNFRQLWADMNWNLGFGTLTYVPTLRTWSQNSVAVGAEPGIGTLIFQTKSTPSDDFVTQELRLASNPDSKFIWQIGGLFYDNHLINSNTVRFGDGALAFSAGPLSKSTRAGGLFAQGTYPVTDTWRVTGGLRFDYTKVVTAESYTTNSDIPGPDPATLGLPEIDSTLVLPASQGTSVFHDVTYKLRLEHDLTAKNLLYASLSTGFSPGDISVTTCAAPGFPPVNTPCVLVLKDEILKTWEVGSKNRFLNDHMQLNVDAYYNDYSAYQAQNVNVGPSNNAQFTTFAVPVQSYGSELELLYQMTADDRVGVNAAWTNAYYVHKPALFAVYVAEDKVANNTVSSTGVAPITANVNYDHIFHLPGDSTLTFHGDGRWMSSQEGDLSSFVANTTGAWAVRVHAQVIGDLSATWALQGNHYTLTGYVRNVGDNRYITAVAATTPPVTPETYTQSQYDPRTYGFIAAVNF